MGNLLLREKALFSFWERLKVVKRFTRTAHSRLKEEKGWNRKGSGEVLINQTSDTILIFHESGAWQEKQGQAIGFCNTFRWTIDPHEAVVSLEHLRYGHDQPVFLFHLIAVNNNLLLPINPYQCAKDVYSSKVRWDPKTIRINWHIIGPKKNEDMEYGYL